MAWEIQEGADRTVASFDAPADPDRGIVFICAHGAGGHMDDRSVLGAAQAVREQGIGVVRFNFFYRARRSGRPDPMPRLLACFNAVIDRVRAELAPARLVIGGRSMGGRAASMLAAEAQASCDGVLLLAYPLHPPGQPQKMRAAHLPSIQVPVLCMNGTRDPFCEPLLMDQVLAGLGTNWRMHWIQGADHSFHVLKSSGRSDQDVLAEVGAEAGRWASTISS